MSGEPLELNSGLPALGSYNISTVYEPDAVPHSASRTGATSVSIEARYAATSDGKAFDPDVRGTMVSTPPPSGIPSVTEMPCERVPLVPFKETGNFPLAVGTETFSTSVPVLPAAIPTGAEVTPAGRPLAETVTVPVNPLKGVTETWMSPEFPRLTASEVGEAESLKSCPVPVNFISIGLNEPPVYANVLTPLIEPAAAGVNVTLRVHVADPARLAPHGLVPLGTALY